ncbi:MAG: hydantoinase/carbamoylase family amidase [Candidatus Limnocylindria bacterium]|nr:hydantoinase/carbamoylase family amidase [Candidatus Limnocylindria bacterium]
MTLVAGRPLAHRAAAPAMAPAAAPAAIVAMRAGSPATTTPAGFPAIDEVRFLRQLDLLAQRGALAEGGLTRHLYTSAWTAAHELVAGWMREAGFLVRRDPVGNLFGRVEGSRGGRIVLVGSHLDTVRAGGALDGALGVVAAIEALRSLVAGCGRPQRIVEVVVLCDAEGGRFGLPHFGARAIAGRLGADEVARTRDVDGVTLADAMRAAGLDPVLAPAAERLDLDAFLELHVEQGRVLDTNGARLGVATRSVAITLLEVTVRGRADDAATADMDVRADALLGAAAMALAVADATTEIPGSVATVGRFTVAPDQAGVVPSLARFTVDLRHEDAATRAALVESVRRACARIAHERELRHEVRILRETAPRSFDPALVNALRRGCEAVGSVPVELVSRADHGAQALMPVARTALLFVPSLGGRSHCADEATAAEDVVLGTRALAAALRDLLY